jgi:hypothetical protein
MEAALDAKWVLGVNSLLDSPLLRQGEFAWLVNGDNTGGIIQTRQGFNAIGVKDAPIPLGEPKGMAIFKGSDGIYKIIVACGDSLYSLSFPITKDFAFIGEGFHADAPVVFTRALQSADLQPDGTLKILDAPIPYLIMQNGVERAKYWDGSRISISAPEGDHGHPGIPIGTHMEWSGDRLWVSQGPKLMASDLGNPLRFFEATYVAGGGAFYEDDDITGLSQTTDLQNLIICTDFNTSALQSSVFDRTAWSGIQGFKRVILPGIGCAAGKSFVKQWGVTWWYSHGGWIGIDQALQTYQRSRIQYRDQQMMRSKSVLNGDKSKIVANKFGNVLLIAVPYGSQYNKATWVLNQRVLDITSASAYQDLSDPSAWTGQWTGITPVDFALCVINGQERLFALSRHETLSGQARGVVWELFTGERQDRYNDNVFQPPVTFETRMLGFSEDPKAFHHAYIDVAELRGIVDFQAFVAGRKGNYHLMKDQQIVASTGSVNSPIRSQFVAEVTADVAEGDTFIPTDITAGALPAPATINIGGRVLAYKEVTPDGFVLTNNMGTPSLPLPAPPSPTILAPILDPISGDFDKASVMVKISAPVAGAYLSYTTDGSDPSRTTGNQVASNQVLIKLSGPGTFSVKTIAFIPDQPSRDSSISNEVYTVVGTPTGIESDDSPDEILIGDLDVPVPLPFPIRKGSQVIQPQFYYNVQGSTILTSYVPQHRVLRTDEWDNNKHLCSACSVESPLTDNVDRGFSMLLKWKGRLAITAIKMMLEKRNEFNPVGCEGDEGTSRIIDQSGCGEKSQVIIEPPTLDSARLQSQFVGTVTQKTYSEEPYDPIP